MRSSRPKEEENRTSEEEQMDLRKSKKQAGDSSSSIAASADFAKSSWLSDSLDEIFTVTGSIQFAGFTESDPTLSEAGCCGGCRTERGRRSKNHCKNLCKVFFSKFVLYRKRFKTSRGDYGFNSWDLF
ncbi:hypothetical protein CDAR_554541 [Caerostris darwini]|uniref:Uncharacterized protein n=1 Tax=Caerostris darwini TaxID=1538125 RepID=A0AAV4TCK9_9ARAC|nr:hypothetical protein CDAR_554541 [Caerostris darwini]